MKNLTSRDVKISDAKYGWSLQRFKCLNCSFIFCPQAEDVVEKYEQMSDVEYVTQDYARIQRARELVNRVKLVKSSGTWLDIGAGIGELVEISKAEGYSSIGIEPSKKLVTIAKKRNRQVLVGKIDKVNGAKFDIISMIDVIEHIENPLAHLQAIHHQLNTNGVLIIVTPDIESLAARVMRRNWWHIRPAHISYFSQKTMKIALKESGFNNFRFERIGRNFELSYLLPRLGRYLFPKCILNLLKMSVHGRIGLNLGDEFLVISRKEPTK